MAAKVVKYKASKKAYVGHVTRTLNSMDEELSKDEIDVDKLQQSVEKLELQYSKVDELSNKIQEESEDIEDIETEVDSMNTLLDKVIQIKSRAKAVVKKEVKIEDVRSPQRDVHQERSERK
jgi:multidrug resistance efflux pump